MAENKHTAGHRLARAGIILLSAAEVQSGLDRQALAEALIRQLPDTHDGRNSWLLNYGESDEARSKRTRWNMRAEKDRRSPDCIFNYLTRSTGRAAIARATQPGEV